MINENENEKIEISFNEIKKHITVDSSMTEIRETWHKFSDDDKKQLALIKSEKDALQEKLNELGLLQESLMEKRSKVVYARNQELTDLFSAKINQAGSYHHKIECHVNRKKSTVTISISDCTETDEIEKMIGKFLSEKAIIEKHNFVTAEGTDPTVTIKLQFYQADESIKALKADHSVFSIPRARARGRYC